MSRLLPLPGQKTAKPKQLDGYPQQPACSTAGTQISLKANFFELSLPADVKLVIHRYKIAVGPPTSDSESGTSNASASTETGAVEEKRAPIGKKLGRIIELFLQQITPASLPRSHMFTDFKDLLFSKGPIPEVVLQNCRPCAVKYRNEYEEDTSPKAPTYEVSLVETSPKTGYDISAWTGSPSDLKTGLSSENRGDLLQALNILLLHHGRSHQDSFSIGTKRFFSRKEEVLPRDLGKGLQALQGFFSSVHAMPNRLLVNVNVSHGAFYNKGPLTLLMSQAASDNNTLDGFLKGCRVKVRYLDDQGIAHERSRTISGLAASDDGLSEDKAPSGYHRPQIPALGARSRQVRFWKEDKRPEGVASGSTTKRGHVQPETQLDDKKGKYVTVFDHLKERWPKLPFNETLPVINVGSSKYPTYVVPEVCEVLFGDPYKRRLDPSQTDSMIKIAVKSANATRTSIISRGRGIVGLNPSTNEQLASMGFTVAKDLTTATGRVLKAPVILYKGAQPPKGSDDGSWNMNGMKFKQRGALLNWSWLQLNYEQRSGGLPSPGIVDAVHALKVQFDQSGININLAEAFSQGQNLDLILVVLPDKDARLYNAVKWVSENQKGVKTTCVTSPQLLEKKVQYLANVALKVNIKTGGVNHGLERHLLSSIKGSAMVVGLDVTHPSPGSTTKYPSVAAMVANVNDDLAQWPAILRLQYRKNLNGLGKAERLEREKELDPRNEMVSEIDTMLESRLLIWKANNSKKRYPDNILIYRDGVSEGQYKAVLEKELRPMQLKCASLYPKNQQLPPRFTLIIGAKRHHTRFFQKDPRSISTQTPTTLVSNQQNQATSKAPGTPSGTISRKKVKGGAFGSGGKGKSTPAGKQDPVLLPKGNAGSMDAASSGPVKKNDDDPQNFSEPSTTDVYINPPQGTIVDNTVIDEGVWNFYLQSHTPIMNKGGPNKGVAGTARPAHYIVLHDEIFKSTDPSNYASLAESLTYNLCFMYARCTRPVSYCTPAYYADRACTRARCYVDALFDKNPNMKKPDARELKSGDIEIEGSLKGKNWMFYI